MIEEVVNSILEAEDVAQKRIADAKHEAGEIVSAAEIEAENYKKQASAQNKADFAQKSKLSDAALQAEANKVLAELNAATDIEISKYERNVDKAVKVILEQLL